MATSFGALCTDFYVNQKLALKMDLPSERETILHLFDQVRKAVPSMERFRRYDEEFALESTRREAEYHWLSLQRTCIRSGHVNPQSMAEAYKLHRLVLDVAPYHLTISPIDIDYLELMFGFDLECKGNHDEVVFEALFASTPLADLLKLPGAKVLDTQPVFGLSLGEKGDVQAFFEVKTRPKSRRGRSGRYRREPISILLNLRQYGPVRRVEQLHELFEHLAQQAEALSADRLVPDLLMPISRQITSSSA